MWRSSAIPGGGKGEGDGDGDGGAEAEAEALRDVSDVSSKSTEYKRGILGDPLG
jgi:hypothetical protein